VAAGTNGAPQNEEADTDTTDAPERDDDSPDRDDDAKPDADDERSAA
jgi:hypothetical protein